MRAFRVFSLALVGAVSLALSGCGSLSSPAHLDLIVHRWTAAKDIADYVQCTVGGKDNYRGEHGHQPGSDRGQGANH